MTLRVVPESLAGASAAIEAVTARLAAAHAAAALFIAAVIPPGSDSVSVCNAVEFSVHGSQHVAMAAQGLRSSAARGSGWPNRVPVMPLGMRWRRRRISAVGYDRAVDSLPSRGALGDAELRCGRWADVDLRHAEWGAQRPIRRSGIRGRGIVGVVASEGWQGQAAEAFVAAYMPFLAWLIQASADCVEMAAQQHVVIEAYTAAVELMPTQVELAANQIKLAVLVATNFFGINTIPIAINEAEYVEMWVRAATTMATYSTVSRSALSAMPHTSPRR